MADVPSPHHRRSIRLPGYDYSQAGAYFLTLVTHQRASLFGEIVDGIMGLNAAGKIVQQEWQCLPRRFPRLQLGTFVVMPNHIHAVLIIRPDHESSLSGIVGGTRPGLDGTPLGTDHLPDDTLSGEDGSPLPGHTSPIHGPKPGSIGAIIGQFKSRVTKRLWNLPPFTQTPIWQRNYYEHIIRSEKEMARIYQYIVSNPDRWDDDEENLLQQR